MNPAIRREFQVAFSRRSQPVWFRVTKWTCLLIAMVFLHDRLWFWAALAGLAMMGAALHFFYRWKTKAWSQAWGGWNDLEAGATNHATSNTSHVPENPRRS